LPDALQQSDKWHGLPLEGVRHLEDFDHLVEIMPRPAQSGTPLLHTPGRIADHSNADRANDHYHRAVTTFA
jgi:hypothetical protein